MLAASTLPRLRPRCCGGGLRLRPHSWREGQARQIPACTSPPGPRGRASCRIPASTHLGDQAPAASSVSLPPDLVCHGRHGGPQIAWPWHARCRLRRRGKLKTGSGIMSETSLYPAVKRFLEAASFDVKGEVKGCDIVAVRAAEGLTLTIVEMKLGFTLDLLLQVTDRMRAADEVWLAVPATRRGRDRDPRVHRLCRLLGFGLMAVSATRDRVEVLVEPGPYQPRRDHRRRRQLLSEHARRRGDRLLAAEAASR